MRKLLLILALLVPSCLWAQSTTVSGTVVDLGSQAWSSGSVVASFVPAPGTNPNQYTWSGGAFNPGASITVATSAGGNYSFSVPSNTAMNLSGSKWTLTANSGTTGLSTQSVTVTITGGTQTQNFTPPVLVISGGPGAVAYADSEVQAQVGQTYYSLTSSSLRVCTASTGSVCNTWASASGSGITSGGTVVDVTQTPFNVKADGFINNDGVTSNTTPTFSSASRPCNVADNGKLVIVASDTLGSYPYGTTLITQIGCSGASYTLSGNANTSASGLNWAIGSASGALLQTALNSTVSSSVPGPGKILQLPCGTMILESPPFISPSPIFLMQQRINIQGCNTTDGTQFIIHPALVAALPTGGTLLAFAPGTPGGCVGICPNGMGGNQTISNIVVTSLGGFLPGTAGQNYIVINNFSRVVNVTAQRLGGVASGASYTFVSNTQGEGAFDRLNLQNFNGARWNGVNIAGQGINKVTNSIFAFGNLFAVSCNGALCGFQDSYCTTVNICLQNTNTPSTWTITGSTINCIQGNASLSCIDDGGQANSTFYVFGNPAISVQTASFPVFRLNGANSVLDISGTVLAPTTAGFSISGGVASVTVNDRAGNNLNGPLTQFGGKYVPIGGGSVANNTASAVTNFGAVLTNVNVLGGNSPATATYDVKIGFRQVTLGVGCGAGSNTVNGVLSWTAGGVAQATGSGGVPALGTLTIAANGAVGTSSAYSSVPVHIDINTQVTFTTTSTLASAGCSTTPQYVVDFSNI